MIRGVLNKPLESSTPSVMTKSSNKSIAYLEITFSEDMFFMSRFVVVVVVVVVVRAPVWLGSTA